MKGHKIPNTNYQVTGKPENRDSYAADTVAKEKAQSLARKETAQGKKETIRLS